MKEELERALSELRDSQEAVMSVSRPAEGTDDRG